MFINYLFPELDFLAPTLHTTGVLPSHKIEELIKNKCISAFSPITEDQIQPASIDLRLGAMGFRVKASFLPNKTSTVAGKIAEMENRGEAFKIDLSRPAILERGHVYLVPLMEDLRLPSDISAKANPKSTTGRLDVFTRLITDYGTEFEKVPPGYRGRLYAEIFPRTFSILVQEGATLNQLRFLRGSPPPSDARLSELHREQSIVYSEQDLPGNALISKGLWISVDLRGTEESEIVGYRARQDPGVIDLSKINHYDCSEFWDPIVRTERSQLILEPDLFYLLASKERVRIPPTDAAEMIAYDPSFGEFRIHYAGFFDPGFGYGNDDIKGSRAVLEVRSHGVPFLLEDGQVVCRLVYERLLSPPQKLYGSKIGSSYQNQGLWLSKQFRR